MSNRFQGKGLRFVVLAGEEVELFDSPHFYNVARKATHRDVFRFQREIEGQGYHFIDENRRNFYITYEDAEKLV